MNAIRRLAVAAAMLGTAAFPGEAQEVNVGDSYEQVLSVLGPPQGTIKTDHYALLTYERGKVEFRGGKATLVSLVSPEEAVRRREEQARQEAEARRLAAIQREALRQEGLAVLAERRADPELMAQTPAIQVEFWRRFRAKYPDVDCKPEYAAALQQYEAEVAAQERDRQIQADMARLEDRVKDAEQRAAEAEERAQRAQRNYYGTGYYYPGAWYTPAYPVRPAPPHDGGSGPHPGDGVKPTPLPAEKTQKVYKFENAAASHLNAIDYINARLNSRKATKASP
jgi:hypothetical protein